MRSVVAGFKFFQYHWNRLEKGSTVVVTLSTAANVRLMDSTNFSAYKNGRNHRYSGGSGHKDSVPDRRAPHWQLVLDHRSHGAQGHQRPSLGHCPAAAAADGEVCVTTVAQRHPA